MSPIELEIALMAEPVTVAFCKSGLEWQCTALEFDIVGIGATRDKAFAKMRSMVKSYLADAISEPGPVDLMNLSDATEYNSCEKQAYKVAVMLSKLRKPRPRVRQELADISALRRLRSRIKGLDLIPISG